MKIMAAPRTERDYLLGKCLSLANVLGVATLLCAAPAAVAATILFPKGSVAVEIDLPGMNCNDGSMLICVTDAATQRAYLLRVTGDPAFVAEAYRVLLRRAADSAGAAYYLQSLASGAITRDGVIDRIMSSQEYRALHP